MQDVKEFINTYIGAVYYDQELNSTVCTRRWSLLENLLFVRCRILMNLGAGR